MKACPKCKRAYSVSVKVCPVCKISLDNSSVTNTHTVQQFDFSDDLVSRSEISTSKKNSQGIMKKAAICVLAILVIAGAVKAWGVFTEGQSAMTGSVGSNGSASEDNGVVSESTETSEPADVIPAGAQTRTIECTMCHGDGLCYHCDGEAYRNGRKCSVCNGTGNCDYCQGVGSFEVFEIDGQDYTICGSCHGEGICGVCDGTGTYSHTYPTLGTQTSKCTLCHGSGKCLSCKGNGILAVAGF